MISPSDYAKDDVLRLLLQGRPGSGKTVVACQMPKPVIIDIDRNMGGALRHIRDHKLTMPVGIEFVDRDEKDQLIPLNLRYQKLAQIMLQLQGNPECETIVIDSGTTLADIMIQEVLRSQGKTAISDFKDGRQFWNFFAIAGRHFMAVLSQIRKHVVLIVHEKVREDEKGNVVYPIEVAWPGQVGDIIGCFFTNVWRCESDTIPQGATTPPKYVFQVRTMPNHQYSLKNTLGVPALFPFDWKIIQQKLTLQ